MALNCLLTHTQVLQVSFEAPPGVKRNLQRTYDAWGPKLISQGSPQQGQLLFMLAWFHAIVQERRAYMSQASLLLSCCHSHSSDACNACSLAVAPMSYTHMARAASKQQQAVGEAANNHHAEGQKLCPPVKLACNLLQG